LPEKSNANIVKPVLIAALVCDLAAMEPHTGKKTLVGIFDKMVTQRLPIIRHIFVYFKLLNGEGEYNLEIRHVLSKNGQVIGNAIGKVTLLDRLASMDQFVFLGGAVFPEYGKYDFQILANDVLLGSAVLEVLQAPSMEG
jgi:hypothetical protein